MTDPRSTARGTPDRDMAGPDSLERPKGRPSRPHNAEWHPVHQFHRTRLGHQSLPNLYGFRWYCGVCDTRSDIYPSFDEVVKAVRGHNRLRT